VQILLRKRGESCRKKTDIECKLVTQNNNNNITIPGYERYVHDINYISGTLERIYNFRSQLTNHFFNSAPNLQITCSNQFCSPFSSELSCLFLLRRNGFENWTQFSALLSVLPPGEGVNRPLQITFYNQISTYKPRSKRPCEERTTEVKTELGFQLGFELDVDRTL